MWQMRCADAVCRCCVHTPTVFVVELVACSDELGRSLIVNWSCVRTGSGLVCLSVSSAFGINLLVFGDTVRARFIHKATVRIDYVWLSMPWLGFG